MSRHKHVRLGLSTVTTLLIILVVVGIIGTYGVNLYTSNFRFFKENVATSFVNTLAKNPESNPASLGSLGSLAIENTAYHPSSQNFSFTFTNTGNVPINITKIEIDSPTLNVTSVFSASTTKAESLANRPVYSTPLNSIIRTVTTTSPSSIIPPGQTFTTGIPYNCITDPLTISVTTSRGTVIKSQVAPNVGWYDDNWKFRKKITMDDTKIIGNPTPIQLDNVKNVTGSGTTITLPNFVVGSGANRLLLVAVESDTGRVQNSSTIMTYGGIALIRANQTNKNTVNSEIWYLTNPPIGTANIVVPMTSSANVIVGAYSFYGVDQTFPISFSANKTRTNSYSMGNVTVYTTNPGSWIVDSMAVLGTPSHFAMNSAQTLGWNYTSTITGGSSRVFNSTLPITELMAWNPKTQLMQWTWGSNQKYAAVAVEIKPSAFYNFPLLVNETTDTDLKNNAMSNRNDILFTSCNGITKLDHEIENYTTATGSLTAWVQVPNIYNTPNNVIYMYYGYNAATNQQNTAGVWDPTFSGVWHFATSPAPPGGATPLIDNLQINATNATTKYQHILKNFVVHAKKDRLLLVGLSTDHPYYYNSVTANGTWSLTQIPHLLFNADSEFWYLLNPPVGKLNILATRCTASTDSACTGGTPVMAMGAYSLYGVDQTTPTAPVAVINSGSGGTASVTVTNIFPNSMLIDQAAIGNGAQTTGKFWHPTWDLASPTQKQPTTNGTGAVGTCIGTNPTGNPALNPTYVGNCPYVMDFTKDTSASSYALITKPCTVTTFSWTATVSDQWVDVAAEIKANSSAGDTTVQDSTSHLNFLSPINLPSCGQSLGKIGGGSTLNGVNQFFTRNTTLIGMPAINHPQTASIWYNATTPAGTFPQDLYSLQNSSGQSGTRAVKMGFQGSSRIDEWKFSPIKNLVSTSPSLPTAKQWHYAVYTYNGTRNSLYIDGVRTINSTILAPPSSNKPNLFYIGASSSTASPASMTEFFKGTVDEFRYSTTARSDSWIATEYNNQKAPSTFYTIGPQERYNDTRASP